MHSMFCLFCSLWLAPCPFSSFGNTLGIFAHQLGNLWAPIGCPGPPPFLNCLRGLWKSHYRNGNSFLLPAVEDVPGNSFLLYAIYHILFIISYMLYDLCYKLYTILYITYDVMCIMQYICILYFVHSLLYNI